MARFFEKVYQFSYLFDFYEVSAKCNLYGVGVDLEVGYLTLKDLVKLKNEDFIDQRLRRCIFDIEDYLKSRLLI